MNREPIYLSLNNIKIKTQSGRATRKKRKHLSLMLFTLLCVSAFFYAIGGSVSAQTRMQRYVVKPGDTVWSIALRQGTGSDPRQAVDQIEQINHLSPTDDIQPNQVLRIPATN